MKSYYKINFKYRKYINNNKNNNDNKNRSFLSIAANSRLSPAIIKHLRCLVGKLNLGNPINDLPISVNRNKLHVKLWNSKGFSVNSM